MDHKAAMGRGEVRRLCVCECVCVLKGIQGWGARVIKTDREEINAQTRETNI